MIAKLFPLCALIGLLFLAACGPKPDLTVNLSEDLEEDVVWPAVPKSAGWQIGFDPRLEPKEDVRQVASLAAWLQEQTGNAFEIYIPNAEERVLDALCAGNVDFAVVGMVSYLQAHEQCGAKILVRGLNEDGMDTYRAAIVVAINSDLQTINDLRGHSFSFGAVNSTQGHLIPRLMLQQAGLNLGDFKTYTYSDSHASTANAVTSHRVDAGALQDRLAMDLAQRGLVRVLAFSDPYPSSGIVAAPHVPEETAMLVQNTLLLLDPTRQDAPALYGWRRTEMPLGFVRATDAEYRELRQIAETIGLLTP